MQLAKQSENMMLLLFLAAFEESEKYSGECQDELTLTSVS
jgi:hypothetical protein